jgi:hypothetical protein
VDFNGSLDKIDLVVPQGELVLFPPASIDVSDVV